MGDVSRSRYNEVAAPRMDRRLFLRRAVLAGGGAVLAPSVAAACRAAEQLAGDPYQPLPFPRGKAVRVRGRVTSGGAGVPGVAVTDGVSVVTTNLSGHFTLVADGAQPFVAASTPAGYRIPVSQHGTAAFYRRLAPDAGSEMSAEFELEPLPESDAAHAFLVLADPQTQNAFEVGRLHGETVPDVRATLRQLDLPAFGVGLGDIMFDDLTLFPEYERAVHDMGVPFFQVLGNHDLVLEAASDDESQRTFQRHFGPTYYSFDRGEVHYVVLDDVLWVGRDFLGYVGQRQQDWLEADLTRVERGHTVVVFLHIPVLSTRSVRNGAAATNSKESLTNREALYRLLEPYRAYVLSGHTHEHERHRDGGVRHHVHGTVCGAWWSGDICWDGTPNGYSVYQVSGSELRWYYQATGQPRDRQMRLYPPGADPNTPSDLVANVWDAADSSWTVVWYENGERRGLMDRRLGLDPLAVEQQAGPDKPPRRTWVQPTVTEHLYYATVSPSARELRVEAIDPWGRVYTEALAAHRLASAP